MNAAFGHWLAGFIDGEGCFRVHGSKRGTYYHCLFNLKVREDEHEIIDEIVRRTKIGYRRRLKRLAWENSQPSVVWAVHSKKESLKLVHLIDRFPLRAKKKNDYFWWRQAVIHWNTMKKGNRWIGPSDWTQMIAFKKAIEAARQFRPFVE